MTTGATVSKRWLRFKSGIAATFEKTFPLLFVSTGVVSRLVGLTGVVKLAC